MQSRCREKSWSVKTEKQKKQKKGCVWRVALTSVHAYSTCWHRHTRLPEASFLGLSVKPYIHTADEEKEGEKQREIIQLDSMQKQQYGKAHLHHVYWTQNMKRQINWIQSLGLLIWGWYTAVACVFKLSVFFMLKRIKCIWGQVTGQCFRTV